MSKHYKITLPLPEGDGDALAQGRYRVNPDGSHTQMTVREVREKAAAAALERLAKIDAKGHDCDEHTEHEEYVRENGGIGDSYVCGICGDLLQVG